MNNYKKFNDTEAARRYFIHFIYNLAVFAIGFLLSYIFLYIVDLPTRFEVVEIISVTGTTAFFYSIIPAMIPAVITSTLVFTSAFTPLGGVLSGACIIWRGSCLGCVVYNLASGSLKVNSHFAYASIIIYFISSVLIFTLSALSSIFRKYIAIAYIDEKYSSAASLSVSFTKLYFILSGVFYLLSTFTIIFIQTR